MGAERENTDAKHENAEVGEPGGAEPVADPIAPDDEVADEVDRGYLTEPELAGSDEANIEGGALTEQREPKTPVGEFPGEPGLPPITLDPPD